MNTQLSKMCISNSNAYAMKSNNFNRYVDEYCKRGMAERV